MDDILIFSSREQLDLATKIQSFFYKNGIICRVWTNDFFRESSYTLENFENLAHSCKKAVVLLGADDISIVRGKQYTTPRDNVLLELGICIGSLGLNNTYFVVPDVIKTPSDLNGITPIVINNNSPIDITASFVVNSIIGRISCEANPHYKNIIMWDEYAELVSILLAKLKQSVNLGGYYFDVILSISRGGAILSNIIARTYGQNIPVYYLLEDRRDGNGAYDTKEVKRTNTYILKYIESCNYEHLLLVDSAIRTGTTFERAVSFIHSTIRTVVTLKTAALILDKQSDYVLDYYSEKRDTNGMAFFYNQFG